MYAFFLADKQYKHRKPGFVRYLAVRPQAHEQRPSTGRTARPDRPGERQNKPRGASRPCRIKRVEKDRGTQDWDVSYKQVIFLCKQVFSDLALLYKSFLV